MKIALIDNYDSFTYNLLHYLESFDKVDVDVFFNDLVNVESLDAYDALVFSPGPGLPHEAGQLMKIIEHYWGLKKMLGVCLGHQALGVFTGSKLKNLSKVYHGVSTEIKICCKHILFQGMPDIFRAGRYHSWVVDAKNLKGEWQILAVDQENEIMAMAHKILPVAGVQFHPESIMTPEGKILLSNWLQWGF